MAKEAEKADLLKHRQKLWEQLGRAGDAGAEVESIRSGLGNGFLRNTAY